MSSIRDVVRVVAAANLLYFGVEIFFALKINSVSLFADSIDFLEDASVNILIFVALGWSLLARRRLSKFFAFLLLIPAISVAVIIIYKIDNPSTPDAFSLTFVGVGALSVNVTCAFLLAKFNRVETTLVMAAFLSARNDAWANVAIITAGLITMVWQSAIPDLIVGLVIGALNASAAVKISNSTEH